MTTLTGGALLPAFGCRRTGPSERPNILLMIADDLRPDFGGVEVPNIRRIGHVATGRCAMPLCAPSRASVLTGLPVAQHGSTDNHSPLPADVLTLPRYLAKSGYRTVGIGKVEHHASEDVGWGTRLRNPGGLAHADGGAFWSKLYERLDVPDSTYDDWHRATATILQMQKSQPPWFIAVGFRSPHKPYTAPARYWHPGRVNPEGIGGDHRSFARTMPELTEMTPEVAQLVTDGYRASVRFLDAQVGRVLDAVPPGTHVILVSDNGYCLGEHGCWSKHGPAREHCWDVPIVGAPGLGDLTGLFRYVCGLAHVRAPSHVA
ncbi:MAG: sulfatase-like hydrolase/transferase [Candidatus Brocadiaceae bacterium]|nr:sulfatase-like hydrolase/transferase [Candidatus Brocadiaceae bacterium]